MKKDSILAITISTIMIAFGIYIFIYFFPFIYMLIGMSEAGKNNFHDTKWDKSAVKYSIFKSQKIHTLPSAILTLTLAKDYDTVIEYSKELEKTGEFYDTDKYFLAKAYMEKGDYQKALKYAKNKTQELQIYMRMKDLEKARIIISEQLAQEQVKPAIYLYKAEIEIETNNWHEANIWIDKLLQINPQHLEALQVKAKILKHYGKTKEYNDIKAKIETLAQKNKKLYSRYQK